MAGAAATRGPGQAVADMPPAAPGAGRRRLLVGLAASLGAAAAGFGLTYSGLLRLPLGDHGPAAPTAGPRPQATGSFLPLERIVLSLGPAARARHLRVAATLEVEPAHRGEVEALLPRVMDVANTFLRAVEVAELEDPRAMGRLRSQLLRRIQIICGEGRVRDLLVTEFVLD